MNRTASLSNDILHKKAVVSLDDGERIGYVEDLLLDPEAIRFAAFVIKGEKGESVLPRDQVRSIGDDAITVDNVKSTQSGANSQPGLRAFSEFRSQKVVDSAGTLVGELHDIEIDPATGAISAIEVRSGGVLGIGAHSHRLPSADICSFGPSLITVNGPKH